MPKASSLPHHPIFGWLLAGGGLLLAWQVIVSASDVPPFILPGPAAVARTWIDRHDLILDHAAITLLEIALGLVLGVVAGTMAALALAASPAARRWLTPVLVGSQAVPVFALAPLLVLWLGYGLAPKIVMAALIIFFPIAVAFLDGLRRTEPAWIDAARTLGCGGWRLLWRVRLPAALPAFASGLRVAVAVTPIGAVIGEWVGSSAGLGYLMLQANARMQIDLMFAALLTLALMAVALYLTADALLRRALPWQPDQPSLTD
jgi:putative hydroxymethylpyrimidine transport system permease protein